MIRPEFTLRRFGRGYRRQDVDALVERLLATLAHRPVERPVRRDELQGLRFRTTIAEPGYAISEVDRFLRDAVAWLPLDRQVLEPYPRPRFTPGRLREGYEIDEVDELVNRIMATLAGTADRPVTPKQLRQVEFTPVRFREGYDVAEVDAFLEKAEGWLRNR